MNGSPFLALFARSGVFRLLAGPWESSCYNPRVPELAHHGNRPHPTPTSGNTRAASNPSRRRDGVGARRLRRDALFPCAGALMRDLGHEQDHAGSLGTLTLLASGIGGVLFGFLADRIGRKQALMASILTYSVCSFASGLATSIAMLAVARFVLGLGMGGEWNTGATLVAESWPTEFRAKAISIVQSSWALGFAAAALVAGPVARYFGWRAVFFVGILPAVITLWIQRSVPESEMWREQLARPRSSTDAKSPLLAKNARNGAPEDDVSSFGSIAVIFRPPYVKHTFALLLFNFFGMFAWWGLVHVASSLFVASCRAGRAGLWRCWHDHADGRAQRLWDVSRLCQLRLGRRSHRSTQGFPGLFAGGGVSDSAVCGSAVAGRDVGARTRWSHFSAREFSPARGSWAAKSFRLPFALGLSALPTTARAL